LEYLKLNSKINSMKNLNTYQLAVSPMEIFPGAYDADYGTGKGVFKSNRDTDIG
jgi:hypothetical protein